MLSCKQFTELVTDHVGGELLLTPGLAFHLNSCPHCRAYLAQMKLLVRLLRQLPSEPISAEVKEQLLLRFRRKTRFPSSSS